MTKPKKRVVLGEGDFNWHGSDSMSIELTHCHKDLSESLGRKYHLKKIRLIAEVLE